MIVLEKLHKTYGDGTEAVKSIDLEIKRGEFITLLGPSGCGKTTTLRLIAGLEEATGGKIWINERDVTNVDPGDRDVAMVFQSYALYPHMTALENMTLNLTVRGMSKGDAAKRAQEVAKILGIQELLDKKPGKLSGGQRQRIALGRAMVRSPVCYLMDEPLSNLDLKLREQMRTELKRLHQRDRVTTVYVTHDQAEALILSDRVVVMDKGIVQQVADPVQIYERPANEFVADFIGSPSINFMVGELTDQGPCIVGKPVGNGNGVRGSGGVTIGVRPEDVLFAAPGSGVFDGRIEFTEPYGGVVYAFVAVEGDRKVIKNRDYVVASLDLHQPITIGASVGVSFREQRINLFDANTGQALSNGR
ncbi:MAG: ABC transporter ATP-binding protein [Alphaproteobacteria bacterium]|nr:ABC transporter ATP-binding protein [Alphaproteobacteria bacterium]